MLKTSALGFQPAHRRLTVSYLFPIELQLIVRSENGFRTCTSDKGTHQEKDCEERGRRRFQACTPLPELREGDSNPLNPTGLSIATPSPHTSCFLIARRIIQGEPPQPCSSAL